MFKNVKENVPSNLSLAPLNFIHNFFDWRFKISNGLLEMKISLIFTLI